jgi:DNA-binding IclR family transcriptional regulator
VLYARLDAPQVLDHGLRREILRSVRERPGQRLAALAREMGVDPKTLLYHVRRLARAGLLHRDAEEGRCFAPGAAPPAAPIPPRAVRAMHALLAGARSPAELARALDVPRGSAGSLLAGLARMGLARREGAQWFLSEKGREALCREPALGET